MNFDIHASANVDGVFQQPTRLPDTVNAEGYDGDVFVAPDESYLIFSSSRPDGFGEGDLYVSFRAPRGGWLAPVNLDAVNSDVSDKFPAISPDGDFLFFASRRTPAVNTPPRGAASAGFHPAPRGNQVDVYWVSTTVIEALRPEASSQLPHDEPDGH